MKFLNTYYPVILAFLSFVYSVYLWFTGNELEGIYVGLWPITILAFSIAIRQRRKDDKQYYVFYRIGHCNHLHLFSACHYSKTKQIFKNEG